MPAPLVHLVRHGEVHNPGRIRYGRLLGYHLSERGRQQAQQAAARLEAWPDPVIYASPLERAVETAEIISIVPGSIVIDARRSTRVLYLHLLDVAEPDGISQAKQEALAVERRVLKAMGSKAELEALRRREDLS